MIRSWPILPGQLVLKSFLSFGPVPTRSGCFASESNPPHPDSHSRSERALRRLCQVPSESVLSIGLYKQNHTQGAVCQVPYEPPGAGTAVRPRAPHRLRQTGVNLRKIMRIWKISTSSSDPRPSRAAGRGGTGKPRFGRFCQISWFSSRFSPLVPFQPVRGASQANLTPLTLIQSDPYPHAGPQDR